MIESASPVVRKILAVGLLLAVILASVSFVIEPAAQRLATIDQEITAKRERAGHLTALLRSSEEMRAIGKSSEAQITDAIYLRGESEAVQLANLQSEVLGIVEREGARLQSSRTLSLNPRDGLQAVGMQITLLADLRTLQGLLQGIETHRPAMVVDGLGIVPALGAVASGTAPADALQIDLRILTLVRPDAGSKS